MENYLIVMKRNAALTYGTIVAYIETRSKKVILLILIICVMCINFIPLKRTIINKVRLDQLWQMWQPMTLTSSISQSYYPNELKCSDRNILKQANKFEEIFSKDVWWSACYAKDYIEKFYLADLNIPYRQNKLFFDIGANKGYTIASWLSMWKPNLGINPKSLHVYLSQALGITDCGACSDCNEEIAFNESRNDYLNTTLEIHAFEPIESTCQALLRVDTRFNISKLYIHQVAISNTSGITNMTKCYAGGELCGLMYAGSNGPNEGSFQVKTITLDDFVEQNKIKQQIDLLKIDTEGADPLVLQGAKKLLSQQQIRMLIFENQGVGAWGENSLLQVIESLNTNGFTCYMLGKTGIARLTNCWSPIFDVRKWSNVLCVHRREERLRRFLDQLRIVNI
jgi:FkbM family methyltransferase